MTRLDGVRLADVTVQLSADQGCDVHRQLGRILRRMHGIEFDTCGEIHRW